MGCGVLDCASEMYGTVFGTLTGLKFHDTGEAPRRTQAWSQASSKPLPLPQPPLLQEGPSWR